MPDPTVYSIYLITCKINGKCYVGQTKNSPDVRFRYHMYVHPRGKRPGLLHHAVNKYGPNSFDFKILEICSTQDEANAAEINHIKKRGCQSPVGYNVMPGGAVFPMPTGRVRSEEHCRKLQEVAFKRGVFASPEALKAGGHKTSAKLKGRPKSEAVRKQMIDSQRHLMHKGEEHSFSSLIREGHAHSSVKVGNLTARVRLYGWDLDKALSTPLDPLRSKKAAI